MTYRIVQRLSSEHPVQRLCAMLGVSRSGYYAWRRRPSAHRVREDRRLKREILTIHTETEGRYGTPRVERSLRRRGVRTSRKRVARLRRLVGPAPLARVLATSGGVVADSSLRTRARPNHRRARTVDMQAGLPGDLIRPWDAYDRRHRKSPM